MNIHVRYKELRSVGECENAEAEASISVTPDGAGMIAMGKTHDDILREMNKTVFNAVRQQIQAARQAHGLKTGDEVIGQDKYKRCIKIWTIEEITNKYIYCVRVVTDWIDEERKPLSEEKKPVAERCVFSHSEVEKATPKLKELAGLA